ncbi:23S rRNA (adenine(2030)-N(6))-methyltransferase RlmJ [Luteimonas pelagia]
MNYRHAFHAGNHADVLKHVVLLALCDALVAKPAPCFALDTHAGRGLYALGADEAARTGEAAGGVRRLDPLPRGVPAVDRYLDAIQACRVAHGPEAYPGSPWLLAHALRAQDAIACCELQPGEVAALKSVLGHDPRVGIHARDGYAAIRALLPPAGAAGRIGRGLVLVDPPYEAQLAEFDVAFDAIRDGLARWPQGIFALWYPIKQARALRPAMRRAASLPAKGTLSIELRVRPDDSPLRMNGSGLFVFNPPWRLDERLAPALDALVPALDEGGGGGQLRWLRESA